MNNLVIDIGNSLVKVAVFSNRQLLHKETLTELSTPKVQDLISQYAINNSIISSVSHHLNEIEALLQTSTAYIRFTNKSALPIQNYYESPDTLGLDRLAALMGAKAIYPHKNTLVIDAGTCITYDAIDLNGRYFGGSISPGLHMRLKALHTFTGKLPLIDFDPEFQDWPGKDTQGSILSGVINGMIAEVKGMIEKYIQQYTELHLLLCGGDANFLFTRLKNSIFAHSFSLEPDLVLIGLNEVIHHQHD